MDYGRKKMEHGGKHSKDKKRMGMMYGGERKAMMHGGPHKNMDRIKMNIGGAMNVQDPN
tara:strand:+ start:362 stop:538 length:177 start_codon:yes stop_codon:yes gene_type:complete